MLLKNSISKNPALKTIKNWIFLQNDQSADKNINSLKVVDTKAKNKFVIKKEANHPKNVYGQMALTSNHTKNIMF